MNDAQKKILEELISAAISMDYALEINEKTRAYDASTIDGAKTALRLLKHTLQYIHHIDEKETAK